MKLLDTSSGYLYVGSKDDAVALTHETPNRQYAVIWNLAEELEFLVVEEEPYAELVMAGDIQDYQIPADTNEFISQLYAVADALKCNEKVFLHCFGGKGRTSLAVAAIKMLIDEYNSVDALAFAKEYCGGPENQEQIDFIKGLSL